MKKITTTLLLISFFFFAKGQTEFLVTVNPTTGLHSIIDSLPSVNFIVVDATAYDKNNKRYIFHGLDFSGNKRLYGIDALTGNIVSQPLFALNVSELQYDNSTNTLFALYYNSSLAQLSLVSIDIATGSIVNVAVLSVTGVSGGCTTFDEANHTFIYKNSSSFYSINTITGNIVVTPAPASFYQFQFDNLTGKLYGVIIGTVDSIVEINVSTGTYNVVGTLPITGYSSGIISYDEINHLYTLGGFANLYSLDVTTGIVVSSPVFPVVPSGENVIELHYDNASGILFALHWGTINSLGINNNAANDNIDFNIYPNPFTTSTTITFADEQNNTCLSGRQATIKITNLLGEEIRTINFSGKQLTIDKGDLTAGIYFVQITEEKRNVVNKKIILSD